MNTLIYICGCSVTGSMFNEREILAVHHCPEHLNLYSQDKTNRQMAKELDELL